jgi:hypothetical protein
VTNFHALGTAGASLKVVDGNVEIARGDRAWAAAQGAERCFDSGKSAFEPT